MSEDHDGAARAVMHTRATGFRLLVDSISKRWSQERGAAMVEYGLLLVLVFVAAIFSIQVFGETLVGLFEVSADVLENAPNVKPEG